MSEPTRDMDDVLWAERSDLRIAALTLRNALEDAGLLTDEHRGLMSKAFMAWHDRPEYPGNATLLSGPVPDRPPAETT